jgi:N-acetylglucosaminyldiphosphoundecaprenol N-acetyl-beta-D-mannosaminyltransferase
MTVLHREEIMGIPFISSSFQETLDELVRQIDQGNKCRVITANPEVVMLVKKDDEVKQIVQTADYVTPDGVGILLAGKLLGKPIRERITGYDLTISLLSIANEKRWRLYLLGAAPEVMEGVNHKIREQYPHIDLQSHHGFFNEDEEKSIVEQIKSHRPHLLLVALGMPKQEKWLQKYQDQLSFNLAMGVGGTFDGISGKVKRAPLLWQRLGVEWLYRLLKEPWRWRRMLALPQFVLHVLFSRKR